MFSMEKKLFVISKSRVFITQENKFSWFKLKCFQHTRKIYMIETSSVKRSSCDSNSSVFNTKEIPITTPIQVFSTHKKKVMVIPTQIFSTHTKFSILEFKCFE
jgi:hypothetical protein